MGSAIGSGEDINPEVCWINPLDVDSYEVVPNVVASPEHLFILKKRKIHNYSGIVFIQTGGHCEVYEHAAKNCFFEMPLHQLKTLCSEQGLLAPSPDLLGHLQCLLACWLPDLPPDAVSEILMQRATLPDNPIADYITDDMMLEELVAPGDQKAFKDCCIFVFLNR